MYLTYKKKIYGNRNNEVNAKKKELFLLVI